VWVPDDTAAADAAAAASKAGLAALDQRGAGAGGSGPRDPQEQDRINALFDNYAQQDKVFGLPAGTTASEARTKDLKSFLGLITNPLKSIMDAFTPMQPKSMSEIGPFKNALHPESDAGVEAPTGLAATSDAAAASMATNAQNAVATGSNVTDPAQRGQAMADAKSDTSGKSDGPNGPEGRGDPGGDRGGWGRGGGYAHGGIASLAGGGLGSLGGYSDGGQLLRGPGDGVSDGIPARIGRNQPARLADGEFVIPARIVSELGNGSTNAGAKQLYKMLDRIQANRKKTMGKNKTAVNSKSARYLPA
jgi:hypothetical protein